jgi:hypothetical protein
MEIVSSRIWWILGMDGSERIAAARAVFDRFGIRLVILALRAKRQNNVPTVRSRCRGTVRLPEQSVPRIHKKCASRLS